MNYYVFYVFSNDILLSDGQDTKNSLCDSVCPQIITLITIIHEDSILIPSQYFTTFISRMSTFRTRG